ncbi:MAG TPA: GreA/GreB family elongation factor [Oxalicibacterium sp.]|nr:GreA/GreB family elongation factor [Oxalicibacterium sp.]
MNKAFVKEDDSEEISPLPEMPADIRNYVTPAGYQAMQQALRSLEQQSPATPRSPNIEQRIQYLRGRLETMEIVDASVHAGSERIYFGATVTYQDAAQDEHTVTLVGIDEADAAHGRISWLSPVAQALLGAYEGDSVELLGVDDSVELSITDVRYPQPDK